MSESLACTLHDRRIAFALPRPFHELIVSTWLAPEMAQVRLCPEEFAEETSRFQHVVVVSGFMQKEELGPHSEDTR